MDVNVNPDKSADINVTLLVNSMVAGMSDSNGDGGINLDEMKAAAEKQGYTVANQKDGDMTGYKMSKHFNKVSELSSASANNSNLAELFKNSDSSTKIFTLKKGFFQDTYNIDLDMNLDTIKPPEDTGNEFGNSIVKSMMSQMDFKFKTTLPIKTVSNNASTVSTDGKSLEWQLIPGQDNKIKVEFKVWNVLNIVLLSVGLLVLLAFILFLMLIRRKRSLKSAIIDNPEVEPNVTEESNKDVIPDTQKIATDYDNVSDDSINDSSDNLSDDNKPSDNGKSETTGLDL